MFLLLFWGTAFLLLYSTSDSRAEMGPRRLILPSLPYAESGIQRTESFI